MIGTALAGIISTIVGKGADLADQFIEDKDKAAQFKAELMRQLNESANKELEAKASIIKAEASGESWLQRNWRPILMLVIVAIVANNYLIAPYASAMFGAGLELDLPERLWDLMTVGVGGYVGGRSAEKVMKAYRGDKG